MSDEKNLLEEVELAGMWYRRKLREVERELDKAESSCHHGKAQIEGLVAAVEALVAAEKRIITAFNNAIPTCYRNQAETALRKGMNP